jgi:hypothetical protein
MTRTAKRLLFWLPRGLCVLFALFISMFAMDVFGAGYGFPKILLAVLMHMIPTLLLVAVLVVAWRWEWVGAVLFTALAVFYTATSWSRFGWSACALISGPLLVLGILFLFNQLHHAELRDR